MSAVRAVFAGSGIAIPPHEIDNHMIARIIDTNDEWIRERSGVVTRYYVDPGVGSAEPPWTTPGSRPRRSTTWSAPP
jgi:3-oxoacyl-[acyl-carrier-protein] synthase III